MTADSLAPSFDEPELLERVESDLDLLVDLVDTFASLHEPQLAAMQAALASSDWTALTRAAHALKGALSTLAARATKTAAEVESAAKGGDAERSAEGVRALEIALPELAKELAELVTRLRA